MTETNQTISDQQAEDRTVPRGMAIAANTAMAHLIDEFGLRWATTAIVAAAGAANHKAGEEADFLRTLENAREFSLCLMAPNDDPGQTEETVNG